MKRLATISRCRGFTLIEIMTASLACALIFAAIYGVWSRAVRMRDNAIALTREARLRARAVTVIRNDLLNAYVSGGALASSLQGSLENPESRFPGFLKFTTTTGRDSSAELHGDVQEVEYFIANDPDEANRDAGVLVRAVDRNLLAPIRELGPEQPLLTGVESLQISFFDGANWLDSWEVSTSNKTLPAAIRVRIQQPAGAKEKRAPAPLEIVVPWMIQPPTATGTNSAATSASAPSGSESASTASTADEEDDQIPSAQEGEIPGEDMEQAGAAQ